MDYPQNDNPGSFHFVNYKPAHADHLSVNFIFGRNLPALPECQGVFRNTIDGLEYLITNFDGCKWLVLYISDVASNIIQVLKSIV